MDAPIVDARSISELLNQECFCITLDRDALCDALEREVGDAEFCATFIRTRPHLFSNAPVFISKSETMEMLRIVRAIEAATKLPGYQRAHYPGLRSSPRLISARVVSLWGSTSMSPQRDPG
jgi:hypothetical protein